MGVAELKYFETEYSLTRVKIISLFVASLSGLFRFCRFGIGKTETHLRKNNLFYLMEIVLNNGLETVLNPIKLTAEMVSHLSRENKRDRSVNGLYIVSIICLFVHFRIEFFKVISY